MFSNSRILRTKVLMNSGQWRRARWSLRRGQERLTDTNHVSVELISMSNRSIGRAWTLKENIRAFLRIGRVKGTRKASQRWIRSAARSKILPMIGLSWRIEAHLGGIVSAINQVCRNGLIEGINSKIRLINAPGYDHHSTYALTAVIYLHAGWDVPEIAHRNPRSAWLFYCQKPLNLNTVQLVTRHVS